MGNSNALELILKAIDKASGPIGHVGGALGGLGTAAQKADKSFMPLSGLFSTGLKASAGLAVGAIAGVTVALGGLAVGAGAVSIDTQKAVADISSSLGISTEEAREFGEVARQVFGNNFADSVSDAGAAVAEIAKQLKLTSDDPALKRITENAFRLRDAFGVEVNESVDAVNTLMSNFGVSADEAFDLVAKGFQKGLNRSDDFLDTIGEYSTQFSSGGATAAQFFNLLESGLQGGMLGTDKAADAFKEFRVRIQDGSDLTAQSLEAIGINAEEMLGKLASGEMNAVQAFNTVTNALSLTGDKAVQFQSGVGLLGTQFEDLGTSALNLSAGLTGGFADVGGAIDSLDTRYATFGDMATGIWRKLTVALAPTTDKLLAIGNQVMPILMSAVDKLTPHFEKLAEWVGQVAEEFAMLLETGVENGFANLFKIFEDGSTPLDRFLESFGMTEEQAQKTARGFIKTTKEIGEFLKTTVKVVKEVGKFIDRMGGLETILKVVAALFAAKAVVGIVAFVTSVVSAVSAVAGFVAGLSGIIGTVAAVLAAITPVGWVIAGIAAAVAGLWIAWKNNFLGIQDITHSVGETIQGWGANLREWGADAVNGIAQGFEDAKASARTALQVALNWIAAGDEGALPPFQQKMFNFGKGALDEVKKGFDAAKTVGKVALGAAIDHIQQGSDEKKPGFWQTLWDLGKGALDRIGEAFVFVRDAVRSAFLAALNWIWTAIQSALPALGGALDSIVNLFNAIMTGAGGFVQRAWDVMLQAGRNIIDAIVSAINGTRTAFTNALSYLPAFFDNLMTGAGGFVTRAWDVMVQVGRNIIEGVSSAINGTRTAFTNALSYIPAFFENVMAGAGGLLGRAWDVMLQVGKNITGAISSAINSTRSAFTAALNYIPAFFNNVMTGAGGLAARAWDIMLQVGRNITGGISSAINSTRAAFTSALNYIPAFFSNVMSGAGGFVAKVWEVMMQAGRNITTGIANAINGTRTAFTTALNYIPAFFNNVMTGAGGFVAHVWAVMVQAGNNVTGGLASMIDSTRQRAIDAFNSIIGAFNTAMTGASGFVTHAWNVMKSVGENIIKGVQGGISAVWAALQGSYNSIVNLFNTTYTGASGFVTHALNVMKQVGGNIIAGVQSGISAVWQTLVTAYGSVVNKFNEIYAGATGFASHVFNVAKGAGGSIIDGIRQGVNGVWQTLVDVYNSVVNKFNEVYTGATGFATHVWNTMKDIGNDVVDGLARGIRDKVQPLRDALNWLAGQLPQWVRDALGIDSPSKVMAAVAKWIPPGLAEGIKLTADQPLKAMKDLAVQMAQPVQDMASLPQQALAGASVGSGAGGQVSNNVTNNRTNNWNVTMPSSGNNTGAINQVGGLVNQLSAIYA